MSVRSPCRITIFSAISLFMFLLAFRDFSRYNAALSHEHNSIAAACGQNVMILQDGNCPSQASPSFETSGDSLFGSTAPLHKLKPLQIRRIPEKAHPDASLRTGSDGCQLRNRK